MWKLVIFMNAIHETWLIAEMVSIDLLQVLNKKPKHKICQFVLWPHEEMEVDSWLKTIQQLFLDIG